MTRDRITKYSKPGKPAVLGVATIGCFLAALALWGTFAPISGAAVADGKLQVASQRQTVQHPYGGIVRNLMVHEGDRVTKGQVLMTLFDSDPKSKLDVLIADNDAALAQRGRLIAERDGTPEPTFQGLESRMNEPTVVEAVANERAMMAARTKQYQNERDVQSQRIAQSKAQIDGINVQIQGNERQEALLQEELTDAESLLEKALVPKTRVLSLRGDLAKLEADRGARLADVARLREEISQTELETAKIDRDRMAEITDQLRTVQSNLAELEPKIAAAKDVLERTEIRAPATGAVVGLTVFTEGGVIQPGGKLLDIVPAGNPLIAEAKLRLTDVNEVAPGRDAHVRLTSINYAERPIIRGTVLTVSADRVTDKDYQDTSATSGESYYAVQVALNPDDVEKSHVELQPGMPAEVIVATRSRTLFEYLISPLRDEITGAFRER